jgi:Porin-like glycoporin RafY
MDFFEFQWQNNLHAIVLTWRPLMTIQTRISMAAALVLTASAAQAAVTFDANLEADPTFKSSRSNPVTKSDTSLGGRIEINANAALMKQGDNFVNARGSLIVPLTGDSVTIDDAWVQFGNSKVDFKLGRQEAADLFPMGKDTVVEGVGVTGGYKANALRGRMKDGRIHGVLGLNAGPGLRAELGVATKKNGSGSAYGFRPTLVYTNGPLAVRLGVESFKTEGSTGSSVTGVGLSMGYAVNKDTTVNVSYARASKLNASSFGLNAVIGAAGIGYVNDRNSLLNTKVNTVYAAYSLPLFNVKNATITPAISHSTGTGVDSLTAVRVRINYAF